MATRACVFLLAFLLGSRLEPDNFARLIVWNVGQGLWTTIVDERGCWHFDMGGERSPFAPIVEECRSRANRVFLSHWDLDHVNFLNAARRMLPTLCALSWPRGKLSARKIGLKKRIPECPDPAPFAYWKGGSGSTSNSFSRVAVFKGVLLPGDSGRAEEKIWLRELPIEDTRILILGHHGSRTATSDALLKRLKRVRFAIASARFNRYGHPHLKVEKSLQEFRVPILRTEDWGHIRIEL